MARPSVAGSSSDVLYIRRRGTLVPASIQRVRVDGVAYRRLLPSERPAAVLNLALRRGDPSAVVRNFSDLVRRAARDRKWSREGLD